MESAILVGYCRRLHMHGIMAKATIARSPANYQFYSWRAITLEIIRSALKASTYIVVLFWYGFTNLN